MSDYSDFSTTEVVGWLKSLGFECIVITPETKFSIISLKMDFFRIKVGDDTLASTEIEGFWYRRGEILMDPLKFDFSENEMSVKYLIDLEYQTIINILQKRIESGTFKIGSYYSNFVSRVEILQRAGQMGILTPDFIVTTSKAELTEFFSKYSEDGVVLKNFGPGIGFRVENRFYKYYTKIVNTAIIDNLAENFPPSLFLNYFKNVFEVRVFFLQNKTYSMAIFNKLKSVDIKSAEAQNSVRYAPFDLPEEIENKLISLASSFGFESGSIDLLVNSDNEYCLLEINPIGQFGYVSRICNYNLEKKIANEFYENKKL